MRAGCFLLAIITVKYKGIAPLGIKDELAGQAKLGCAFGNGFAIHAEVFGGRVADNIDGCCGIVDGEGLLFTVFQVTKLSAKLATDLQFAVFIGNVYLYFAKKTAKLLLRLIVSILITVPPAKWV